MFSSGTITLPDRRPSAIVLDLDGTALRPDGTISPGVRKAVADAVDAGTPVAIATGRSEREALALARDMGLVDAERAHGKPTYVISTLGAVTTEAESGAQIEVHHIDPAVARDALTFAQSHGYDATVVTSHLQIARTGMPPSPFTDETASDLRPFVGDATMIRFAGDGVGSALGQFASPSVAVSSDHSLVTDEIDIAPANTDKGSAVRALLAHLGADPSRAMAIGDTEVDAPMLRAVGQGVAMGNASSALDGVTPYRTATNAHDGVALAIEHGLSLPATEGTA